MTSKECDRGRRERAKCDETKWVSTILLVESQYLKLKHGPYEKFFDLIEIGTFTTCYDQSTILTAGHFYFLAKWQNSSKNVPHNQFKPSLQGKLADFRDLLALISSPFFSLVTMWRVLRFWCLMGILALVHSSAVGPHLTLPDALYHARIDPKILRCTLQTTPPLIKP